MSILMPSLNKSAAAPVRSMTGYARVRAETSAGELTLSLRTVNHRGLDLHFHVSGEFAPFENAMRAQLKLGLRRGHVEIRAGLAREAAGASSSYNRDLLRQHVASFRQAAEEFGLDSKPDLNLLLRMPGVLDAQAEAQSLDASFEAEVVKATKDCIDALNACREREGNELRLALVNEADAIAEGTKQMTGLRVHALPAFQRRLQGRLAELLRGAPMEEHRIVQEAAVLADRSDIAEELTRLNLHAQETLRILGEGGEVGKRLDFLLQEMNRETNTVLSKTSGAGDGDLAITNLALSIKATIEKIREQALNLE